MKKVKGASILILAILLFITSFYIDSNIVTLFANTRNSFSDIFMRWFTNFASLFVVLFFIPTLFLYRDKKYSQLFFLWFSFFSSVAVSFFLKLIVARARPLESIAYAGLLDYSFPSMHTLVAFAAIPMLDRNFPKLRLFWVLFAFFVSLSRLYFNLHYLSDVVAGALIGYAIGLLFINLEHKYKINKINHKK